MIIIENGIKFSVSSKCSDTAVRNSKMSRSKNMQNAFAEDHFGKWYNKFNTSFKNEQVELKTR